MDMEAKLPPKQSSSEVKPPAPAEGSTDITHDSLNNNKKLGKLSRMLSVFASGQRLHRFTAEKIADHCLPTTISDLQARYSLSFSRDWLTVPNRFGSETRVRVYWLEGDNLERAQAIIDGSALS